MVATFTLVCKINVYFNYIQCMKKPIASCNHYTSPKLYFNYLILKCGLVNLTELVFTDHIKQPRHSSYFNLQYYLRALIAYMYI